MQDENARDETNFDAVLPSNEKEDDVENQPLPLQQKPSSQYSSLYKLFQFLIILFVSQCLSFLITCTGITSTYLSEHQINIPTAQSILLYFVLACIYLPITLLLKKKQIISQWNLPWYYYILLAALDVEANYCVVKAYQYTSITSILLLDCFTIPCVMILSWFILAKRFGWNHFVGVVGCLLGIIILIISDYQGISMEGWFGDVLSLVSSLLYSLSNVFQEYALKKKTTFSSHSTTTTTRESLLHAVEYIGFVGLFGTILSLAQFFFLEQQEMASLLQHQQWTLFTVTMFGLFGFIMVILYTGIPLFLIASSATFMNLSFMSSDAMAVISSIVLFGKTPSVFYFVSFGVIFVGLVVYNLFPEKQAQQQQVIVTN